MSRTIHEIEKQNTATGFHWFEPESRRFFGSRVSEETADLPDGRTLFVSSEQDSLGMAWGGRRLYSLRVADLSGKIDTVGEFGAYETRATALSAMRKMAREAREAAA